MLGWLIVLCPLIIAFCRTALPLVVVAARSSSGVVTYPAGPTLRAEGDGLCDDAPRLPENPDHRDDAPLRGWVGCRGLRVREGCRMGPGQTAVAASVSGL